MPDQQGTFMTTRPHSFAQQIQTVAELMLAVAGESVSVIKRAAPEQALKLKHQDEWTIYLEFLRVMFNLTDRVSAIHIRPTQKSPGARLWRRQRPNGNRPNDRNSRGRKPTDL